MWCILFFSCPCKNASIIWETVWGQVIILCSGFLASHRHLFFFHEGREKCTLVTEYHAAVNNAGMFLAINEELTTSYPHGSLHGENSYLLAINICRKSLLNDVQEPTDCVSRITLVQGCTAPDHYQFPFPPDVCSGTRKPSTIWALEEIS